MKRIFFFSLLFTKALFYDFLFAQEQDTLKSSEWNFNIETDLYFTDPFFVLPIFSADKENLHLEARYNYEDIKTVSVWIGYNFSGGRKFEYLVTPMVGGVAGRTKGIAPGVELTFDYIGFELYSEMEYVFDLESNENNFFYSWTDFTYSPFDWLWFGISGQRTKVYKTDLEIQRGFMLGGSYSQFELTGYFYEPGSNDFYIIITLAYNL